MNLKTFFNKNLDFADVLKWTTQAVFVNVIAAALHFYFNIFISKALGADGVGQYYLIFSVVSILMIVVKYGYDKIALRVASVGMETGEWITIRRIINKFLWHAFLIAAFLNAGMFLFGEFLAEVIYQRKELAPQLVIFSLSIFPIGGLLILSEAYKGIKKVALGVALKGVVMTGTIISILAILCQLNGEISISNVIYAYVTGAYLTFFLAFIFWHKFIRQHLLLSKETKPTDVNIIDEKGGISIFLFQLSKQVIIWAPVYFIGLLIDDTAVGQYSIAYRVSALFSFFLVAFNSSITPKIGKFIAKGEPELVEKLCQKSTLIMTAVVLPCCVLFVLLSDFILGLFGPSFMDAKVLLYILMVGQVVNIMFGPVNQILIMYSHQKILKNITFFTAILCVAGIWLVAPYFGLEGVAMMVTFILIFQNLAAAAFVYSKLNIITLPIQLKKY